MPATLSIVKPSAPKATRKAKEASPIQSATILPEKPSKASLKLARALQRQRLAACGVGMVALALTGLSLSHLAEGIAAVTHSPTWQSWAMGVGIDLGFVGLELATILTASQTLRKRVEKWSRPTIGATLVLSAALNAQAFISGSTTPLAIDEGIVLGVAIPAMIYALTQVATSLYMAE
jgi:hypothetical protein